MSLSIRYCEYSLGTNQEREHFLIYVNIKGIEAHFKLLADSEMRICLRGNLPKSWIPGCNLTRLKYIESFLICVDFLGVSPWEHPLFKNKKTLY